MLIFLAGKEEFVPERSKRSEWALPSNQSNSLLIGQAMINKRTIKPLTNQAKLAPICNAYLLHNACGKTLYNSITFSHFEEFVKESYFEIAQ